MAYKPVGIDESGNLPQRARAAIVAAPETKAAFAGRLNATLGTPTQLTIPTYDGSGQATHPSVIDLGSSPVSGFRYWMAFTPYTGADNTKENPSIVASNDLITWAVPTGLTNPVVGYPGSGSYNSDTHLIFWGGKFWMYYRTTTSGKDRFYVVTSTDGVTWAAPRKVFEAVTSGYSVVSPAFRVVNGKVACWFVRNIGGTAGYPNEVYRFDSIDGYSFGSPRKVSVALPDGATPWHLDVDYGTDENGRPVYLMAANCYTNGSDANHASLYFASSGDGFNFIGIDGPALTPGGAPWYSQGLYRPSILRRAGVAAPRIFFGAYNGSSQSATGYADLTVKGWGRNVPAMTERLSSDYTIGEAFVGSSYTVGTAKLKGITPTLILPKATSSVSYMHKSFGVPRGVGDSLLRALVEVFWLTEDANTGNVRFRVYDVDTILGVDNLGGSKLANGVLDVAVPGVANTVQKATFNIGGDHFQDNSVLSVRVSRDGQDAADTYASDVLLLGWRIRYGEVVSTV